MSDDLFSRISETDVRQLTITSGDVLFHQSEPTTGLYRVIQGCVTLRRTTEAGDELTLHRATSGDFFAEASVFSDLYHCDAVCTLSGKVQRISKSAVLTKLSHDPEFAVSFSALLARQVQTYRHLLEITAIKSAEERVLAAIAEGYLMGTVVEFATRIHLTHEACYRALRLLCKKNRLKQTGRGKYQLVE